MSIVEEISHKLQERKTKDVRALVTQALEEQMDPLQILNEGLLSGMTAIGEQFKAGEIYIPEVMLAARAMKAGMEILQPSLSQTGTKAHGKVCIGTVRGDQHDIGKNLVKIMMEGKGIEVVDLGVNVSAEQFVQTAITQNCSIICCSALLTTTMVYMKEVVRLCEKEGIRDKVKIMIGGAPVTQQFCDSIGADIYTEDAASAADAAFALCRV